MIEILVAIASLMIATSAALLGAAIYRRRKLHKKLRKFESRLAARLREFQESDLPKSATREERRRFVAQVVGELSREVFRSSFPPRVTAPPLPTLGAMQCRFCDLPTRPRTYGGCPTCGLYLSYWITHATEDPS